MRLLLSIDTEHSVDPDNTGESIHDAYAHGSAPARPAQGRLGDDFEPGDTGDRSISDMLALLDTLPASSSAEAFAALRRAFPHVGLGARVEAVRKRRTLPRQG